MAHFAELDENNVVVRVLVIDNNEMTVDGVENEQLGIDFLNDLFPDSGTWIQTSYNGNIRGRFAGEGTVYLPDRDLFQIEEKPYPSWSLNDEGYWVHPDSAGDPPDGFLWDEDSLSWVKPESPYPSWVWNEGDWKPPTPYPLQGLTPEEFANSVNYEWNEDTQAWDEIE
jgi:hypothetical protein|tara:strand:- start:48 stop:554 length:507 start_codon:yes stop_codon:yes gene_type:complete